LVSKVAPSDPLGWWTEPGLNDIELEAPDDDAYDLVIAIASSAITSGLRARSDRTSCPGSSHMRQRGRRARKRRPGASMRALRAQSL